MLLHKGGQINNVQMITGVRIVEMSQLQNCSVMCAKKEVIVKLKINQRTNGPVNAHLISWPSKAQNLENIW